ncbi:hypothetical protein FPV67DRAFT_1097064 [Lyophyllum atratum]|nr:hypothetical protein FPV67DRAFT_1097064 [Lyophyllum atratum]
MTEVSEAARQRFMMKTSSRFTRSQQDTPYTWSKTGLNVHDPLTQLNGVQRSGAMAGLNRFADMGLNASDSNVARNISPGTRQVATGLNITKHYGARVFVTSMCIGSGMGMAAVFVSEQ